MADALDEAKSLVLGRENLTIAVVLKTILRILGTYFKFLHLQDDIISVHQVQVPTKLLAQIRLTEDPNDLESLFAVASSLDSLAVKSVT